MELLRKLLNTLVVIRDGDLNDESEHTHDSRMTHRLRQSMIELEPRTEMESMVDSERISDLEKTTPGLPDLELISTSIVPLTKELGRSRDKIVQWPLKESTRPDSGETNIASRIPPTFFGRWTIAQIPTNLGRNAQICFDAPSNPNDIHS
ncbi:hypothetical protein Dimus_007812, partial [Dionaea muscipula]